VLWESQTPVAAPAASQARIDRRALVTRHNPVLRRFDPTSPLSIGNGEFAFTADATGLQTFPDAFENTTPLGTLSQWGWHTSPNPNHWTIDTFRFTEFESHGRKVGYADIPGNQRTSEMAWLRSNPHRLHLGQIGFVMTKADGQRASSSDLANVEQTLDLWDGVLLSHFTIDGQPVDVETVAHPTADAVAVRARSPLVRAGRLAITLRFPYGTGGTATADWAHPESHVTTMTRGTGRVVVFHRRLDDDAYVVRVARGSGTEVRRTSAHEFLFEPNRESADVEVVAVFSRADMPATVERPYFDATRAAASSHWHRFWQAGGAIDLSGSRDPRWKELERRIVLSQYLTAIQCAGEYPPQETGLTYNSWEGKFHLEMHWWHAAHFALWNRLPLLERSLGYYHSILPRARATAARQGYAGARWPKMTSPSGAESPSNVGPFLVWQQPHPIFFAELCYRTHPDRATLERYQDVVFATAQFMASFAAWDEPGQRYVLGPPLQCAQETYPKDRTFNCSYELEYWRWGLSAAQRWRERLGLARDAAWDKVLGRLAAPHEVDGKFLFAESAPDTYTNPKWATDHPSVVAAFGLLPGEGLDSATRRRTIDWIWQHWDWPSTWGWDYPMMAMSWARLGEPGKAIDALLMETPKNAYHPNGHNYQRPGLTIYLPGNGGLLYAVAMMAAGWDGAPARHAPGFPSDGSWVVRWEGLRPGI